MRGQIEEGELDDKPYSPSVLNKTICTVQFSAIADNESLEELEIEDQRAKQILACYGKRPPYLLYTATYIDSEAALNLSFDDGIDLGIFTCSRTAALAYALAGSDERFRCTPTAALERIEELHRESEVQRCLDDIIAKFYRETIRTRSPAELHQLEEIGFDTLQPAMCWNETDLSKLLQNLPELAPTLLSIKEVFAPVNGVGNPRMLCVFVSTCTFELAPPRPSLALYLVVSVPYDRSTLKRVNEFM